MYDILLVYPKAGFYDQFIQDLPLSLIYAAQVCYGRGYKIKIIDQRIETDWKKAILSSLSDELLFVGISVMTGKPIFHALEISRFVKENSNIPTVWGGIHPTIEPETTLANNYINMIVRGRGEEILYELAESLEGKNFYRSRDIEGLSYKENGKSIIKPPKRTRKKIRDGKSSFPPYDLVNVDNYFRFSKDNRVFSLITSFGCPHDCAFCYSPSFSGKTWEPETVQETIVHIEFILNKYRPNYISIIDNDFFVSLPRAKRIFEEVKKLKFDVSFGFRGTRIDELVKMDDNFLGLMQDIGVKHLHIGAESGSQKILDLYSKKIRVEQILEVNKILSKFREITPTYNFFAGIPTETEDDLRQTTSLIMRLLEDNPQAQITGFDQFTPYPGSKLFEFSVENGFIPPKTLEEWIHFDEDDCSKNLPWTNKKRRKLLNVLGFASVFIDKKIENNFNSKKFRFVVFRIFPLLYRSIARFRFKHLSSFFPVEIWLKSSLKNWIEKRMI